MDLRQVAQSADLPRCRTKTRISRLSCPQHPHRVPQEIDREFVNMRTRQQNKTCQKQSEIQTAIAMRLCLLYLFLRPLTEHLPHHPCDKGNSGGRDHKPNLVPSKVCVVPGCQCAEPGVAIAANTTLLVSTGVSVQALARTACHPRLWHWARVLRDIYVDMALGHDSFATYARVVSRGTCSQGTARRTPCLRGH